MYGTVARFQLRSGMEEKYMEHLRDFAAGRVPGWIAEYVYRMDADPNEYYAAVIFESKEAYVANANSLEQDARYLEFRELLTGDPEWHDGTIVNGR